MFDELKSRAREYLARSEASPLSIAPGKKDITGVTFGADTVGKVARIYPRLAEVLGNGMPTWSGESVTARSSLSLSAVYACHKLISESVGFIPAVLRQQKGKYQYDADDHPMFMALQNAPNDETSAQTFWEVLTAHCVMSGNGFAKITRRSGTGTAIELWNLMPDNVRMDREKTGQKRLTYVVKEDRQPDKSYSVTPGQPHDIYHQRGLGWDGVRGYSVIHMARQSWGTAIAQERNVAQFYANGGRVPYTLELDKDFEDDQEADKFQKDWQQTYSDPHRAPIMPPGMKYHQIGISAADAQLLESRQFTIPEVCRWFGVSPHLVGDLSRASFSNVESLADQFYRLTLFPWTNRRRQDYWRCVLTPEEKAQGLFLENDTDELLKGSFKERMEAYAAMLQCGKNSINEVRGFEGENPVEGGDEHYVQVNLAPVGPDGKPINTGRVRVGAGKEPS